MRKPFRSYSYLFLVTILAGILTAPTAFAQGAIQQVYITGLDSTRFPDVAVLVRVLDQLGSPVNISSSNLLTLTENTKGVNYTVQQVQASIRTVIVFDIGAGSGTRLNDMVDAALKYVDTMQAGDTVEVIVVEPSEGAPEPTQLQAPAPNLTTVQTFSGDKDQIKKAINDIRNRHLITNLTLGLVAVQQALNDLRGASGGSQTANFLLYFSHGVQAGGTDELYQSVEDLANNLGEKRDPAQQTIPIYTIAFGASPDTKFFRLANNTHGRTAIYNSANALDSTLSALGLNHAQYQLTFRSSLNTTGDRVINVSDSTGGGSGPGASITYNVSLQPPTIVFTAPGNSEVFTRKANAFDTPLDAFEPASTVVQAQVTWSGQNSRRLVKAALLVDGQLQGVEQTNPSSDDLSFPWDLRAFQTFGSSKPQLQIRVVDELGFEVTSDPVIVTVVVDPPPAKPGECDNLSSAQLWWCSNKVLLITSIPGWTALGLAILTLVLVIVFRRQLYSAGGVVVGEVSKRIREATRRLTKAAKAKAYLIALDGLTEGGRNSFALYGTTPIGRDGDYSELLFHRAKENSPISGKHCTILEDAGDWNIRDETSTNGTFLNGVQVDDKDASPLKDRDIIELAQFERGGIRLEFRIAGEGGSLPEDLDDSSDPTKRVHRTV